MGVEAREMAQRLREVKKHVPPLQRDWTPMFITHIGCLTILDLMPIGTLYT